MASGYDEDGSLDRLVCLSPPDGGGDDGGGGADPESIDEDAFIPNVFLAGTARHSMGGPVGVGIDVGLDDWSVEGWAMPFWIGDLAHISSAVAFSKGGATSGGLIFLHNVGGAGPYLQVSFGRATPPGGFILGAQILAPLGWHHYAAVFDRGGDCTVYIDATLVDTFAIVAGVADNLIAPGNAMRPIVGGNGITGVSCCLAYGPAAVHIGQLMTVADMRESIRTKYVQDYGGIAAPYTAGIWDPKRVTGHVGWNITDADMRPRIYQCGPAFNIKIPISYAAPEGANNSVIVPDQSVNGNDLWVVTDTSYDPLSVAYSVFGADPFFR